MPEQFSLDEIFRNTDHLPFKTDHLIPKELVDWVHSFGPHEDASYRPARTLCSLADTCTSRLHPLNPIELPQYYKDYRSILQNLEEKRSLRWTYEHEGDDKGSFGGPDHYTSTPLGIYHHDVIENQQLNKLYSRTYRFSVSFLHERHPQDLAILDRFYFTSFEQDRKLQRLIIDQEAQIPETLAFFHSHLELLQQPDYQLLFKKLLFVPGLLLKELTQSPPADAERFVKSIDSFLFQQYRHAISLGNIKNAMYFLNVSDLVRNYVAYAHSQRKNLPDRMSLETKKETEKLLSHKKLTHDERSLVHMTRSLSLLSQDEPSSEDLTAGLTSAFYAHILYPTGSRLSEDNYRLLGSYIRKHTSRFESICSEGKQDNLLNSIANAIYSDNRSTRWAPSPSFPLFESADGEMKIDLLKMRLQNIKGDLDILPKDLPLKHRLFQYFNQLPEHVTTVGTNIYEFKYNGKPHRIAIVKAESRDLAISQIQTPLLYEGKELWHQLISFPNDTPWHFPWLPSTISLSNTIWKLSEVPNLLLATNPTTNAPTYAIKIKGENENTEINIYKLDEQGMPTGLKLVELKSNSNLTNGLFQMEDPSQVMTWINEETGKLNRLEMPRFGLNFTVSERKEDTAQQPETMAASVEYQGYHIAQDQFIPALYGISQYLVLENEKGEKKVLIAQQELKKTVGSLDLESASRNQMISREQIDIQKAHAYDLSIDEDKTGMLLPTSEAGRFYLAQLQLWNMDYARAIQTLRGFESFTRPYNEEERNILLSIIKLKEESKDSHPEALAVQLYAQFLVLNNLYNFEKDEIANYIKATKQEIGDPANHFSPIKEYNRYLSQLRNIHQTPLKPHEEVQIIEFLVQLAEMIRPEWLNRLIEIDPDNSHITQAQYAANTFLLSHATSDTLSHFVSEIEGDKNVHLLKRFFDPDTTEKLSLPFTEVYRLVKAQMPDEERRQLFKKITGQEMIQGQMMNQLKETIDFLILNYPEPNIRQVLQVLRAFVEVPGQFPSYSDLMSIKEGISWAFYFKLLRHILSKDPEPSEFFLEELRAQAVREYLLSPAMRIYDTLPSLAGPLQTGITPFDPAKSQAAPPPQRPLPGISIPVSIQPIAQIGVMPDITFIRVEGVSPSLSENEKNELSSIYPNVNDNVINRETAKIKDSIQKAYQIEMQESKTYSIPEESQGRWQQYVADLSEKKTSLDIQMREMEMDLLIKANRLMPTSIEKYGRLLDMQGRGNVEITIDALIQLFWRRDVDLFVQANPALTRDDVKELIQGVSDYLVASTHAQQISRVLDQASVVDNARKEGTGEQLDQALREFVAQAGAKRSYDIRKFPQYLVLEHYLNILIRPEQIDNLAALQGKTDQVTAISQTLGITREMIMGSGKSFVLTPLLALLEADGEHLAFCVVPETLLTDTSERLHHILGKSYDTSVQVLQFDRTTPTSEQHLKHLLRRLQKAVGKEAAQGSVAEGPQIFLTTSSDIQSMALRYEELLIDYRKETDSEIRSEMEKEIILFQKIFNLFKLSGRAIVDEADIIFNVRKELHYTIGTKKLISGSTVSQTLDIFELLVLDPEISNKLQLEFSVSKKGAAFTDDFYRREIAPLLTKKSLAKLSKNLKTFAKLMEHLPKEKADLIEKYVAEKQNREAEDFVKTIEDLQVRDALSLLREQIHDLLPLTLDKIADINYARDAKTNIAIPSHGKDAPAIGSEHGTPFETLNYTIQNLINTKIAFPVDIITEVLNALRSDALKELQENKKKSIEETKGYQNAQKLLPQNVELDLMHFDRHIDELAKAIDSSGGSRLAFAREYLPSRITLFQKTISTHPQLFSYLFDRVTGFTGTQWNSDTFPEGIQAQSENTVTGKTLNILWKGRNDPVTIISTSTPKDVFTQLHAQNPNATVIIDTAGSLRGTQEVDVAREWLNKAPMTYRGVVFYDLKGDYGVKDRKMILERGKKQPIPLEHSDIPAAQRMTIYDQKHTTGSDIKQAPNALAICTINQHTTLRDMMQAVWRLRQLDRSQKVRFAVEAEAKQIIIDTIEEVEGKPIAADMASFELNQEHLLRYITYKQALLQGNNNFRALKQKLKAVLEAEVFSILIDENVSPHTLEEVIENTERLFVTENTDSPWELFGISPIDVDKNWLLNPDNLFKLLGQNIATVMENIASNPFLSERIDLADVKARMLGIIERSDPLLPPKLSLQAQTYGRETENELEAEKEKEQQKEKQLEMMKQMQSGLWAPRNHITMHPDYWLMQESSTAPSFLNSLMDWTGFAKIQYNGIDSVLATADDLKPYASFFDTALKPSANFAPIRKSVRDEAPYEPFGQFQKGISGIAVIERRSGDLQFVMLDLNDMVDVRKYLSTEPGSSNGKISLYNLDTGFDRFGGCDIKRIESNPKFMRGIVQAKFFDGRIDYTDEEIPYLKEWITEKGAEQAKKLFQDHILAWKSDTKLRFSISPLGKIFNELLA